MALRHVILAMLSREPATGYDIVKAFDESLAMFWSASHQQIYRDLKLLADQGLVEFARIAQAERPDKKLYSLTGKGRDELATWFEEPLANRVNSDLLVRLLAIETVGAGAVQTLLSEQRAQRSARLQGFYQIERTYFDDVQNLPVYHQMIYLALRRGIKGEEDWLSWIDEADSLIAALPTGAGTGKGG